MHVYDPHGKIGLLRKRREARSWLSAFAVAVVFVVVLLGAAVCFDTLFTAAQEAITRGLTN